MARKKRVKIDDYNATIEYDFPFDKDEQVIIDGDGNTGIVIDAEWWGNDDPAMHHTITYWIKSNVDGSVRKLKLAEILALNLENFLLEDYPRVASLDYSFSLE